jgi:SOS response regulatory protein OraA/RecX
MKIQITENQLREVIETNVRRILFKEDEDKIVQQLRQPGINQAEIARYLMQTTWEGMDEDTARSLLSKKVRGEISMTDSEKSAIKRALDGIIKMD